METLPESLCFPKPPFRLELSGGSAPSREVVSAYLNQIQLWRKEVLEFLKEPTDATGRELPGLSERAKRALECFLSTSWDQGTNDYAEQSPYNIAPFPIAALEHAQQGSLDLATQVLLWRAAVIDYLSDIWDVIGEPLLDMDECWALGLFLNPADKARLCPFCLAAEIDADKANLNDHDCPFLSHVRAKWPPSPFKNLNTEASPEENRTSRSWWRFWRK